MDKLTDSAQEAAETQTWLEFSFHCKYIDEETFQRLDDSYEHEFAMLNSMEKKADTFCRPSSYRSGRPSSVGYLSELCGEKI